MGKTCISALCVRVFSHSVMSNSATPWTVAHQAPLSMGFSRQGYWSGLPWSPPGDLPNLGIESRFPHCRLILCCLRHQGSPISALKREKTLTYCSIGEPQGRRSWSVSPVSRLQRTDLHDSVCIRSVPRVTTLSSLFYFRE